MKMYHDDNAPVMTFDEYRLFLLRQPKPRPVSDAEADRFLVRPPEKSTVLVVKKTPIGREHREQITRTK